MSEKPIGEIYDDEIDLSQIVSMLWKRRKLIIFGTLAITLLSVAVSFFFPKVYRSDGYYQLGNPTIKIDKETAFIGIPIPLYKAVSTQFYNPNNIRRMATPSNMSAGQEIIKITQNFEASADLQKWFKPVYAYSREDALKFSQMPTDQANRVIGMHLTYESHTAQKAATVVGFLGKYVRDCLLYQTLYNFVIEGYTAANAESKAIENDIINTKFELRQNKNKMDGIQAIISKYPQSAQMENRQVVSIQDGGERFLAPVSQLVGIESTMTDIRQTMAGHERERDILTIRTEYFSRCLQELSKIGEHGDQLFSVLKSIKEDVFSDKDLDSDVVQEASNYISMELEKYDHIFSNYFRFISGPTTPTKHIKPRRSIIVATAFLVSFFALVVFSIIFEWWLRNKASITSSNRHAI